MKFPGVLRRNLESILNMDDFELDRIFSLPVNEKLSSFSSKIVVSQYNIPPSINHLKSDLCSLIENIMDNRQHSLDIATVVINLFPPLSDDITIEMLQNTLYQLKQLRMNSMMLYNDTDHILDVNVKDTFSTSSNLHEFYFIMQEPITILGGKVKDEINKTIAMLDNSIEICCELIDLPRDFSCRVESIGIDFSDMIKINQNFYISTKAKCFMDFMTVRSLPVCPLVFCFLQGDNSVLYLRDYTFVNMEFARLAEFFLLVNNISLLENLTEIRVVNCNLNDRDMYNLFLKLFPHCTSLKSVILRDCNVTDSGIISLAISLYARCVPRLICLKLEGNCFTSDGLRFLCCALHNCVYLSILSFADNPIGDWGMYYITKLMLNPRKRIFQRFPKPNDIHIQPLFDINKYPINLLKPYFSFMQLIDDGFKFSEKEFDTFLHSNDNSILQLVAQKYLPKTLLNKLQMKSSLCLVRQERLILQLFKSSYSLYRDESNNSFLQDQNSFDKESLASQPTLLSKQIKNKHFSVYTDKEFALDLDPYSSDSDAEETQGKVVRKVTASNHRKILELKLNKIQKLFVKIQYKLFAVITIKQLLRPSTMQVSSLNLKNCQFGPRSILLASLAFKNLHSLRDFDLSQNPEIFNHDAIIREFYESNPPSISRESNVLNYEDTYVQIYKLIAESHLQYLKLNSCGINDFYAEIISKAILKSSYLRNIQLSDNTVGNLGLTKLLKRLDNFYIDHLGVGVKKNQFDQIT